MVVNHAEYLSSKMLENLSNMGSWQNFKDKVMVVLNTTE